MTNQLKNFAVSSYQASPLLQHKRHLLWGAGVRWTPLPKAEALSEATAEYPPPNTPKKGGIL